MLEVIEILPSSKVLCKCDCGNQKVVLKGHFNAGYYKSCGCHHGHGKCGSKEYVSYGNMIARCHNPANKRYKDYGGKGIVVCNEWREDIRSFFRDMGDCPEGFQIERIDNTKGYYKENCKWASRSENMRNRSVSRIWIVSGNEYPTSIEAALAMEVSPQTIVSWCKGRKTKNSYYPPKEDCSFKYVYVNF